MPHAEFQSCIDACNACATACDHCAAECLKEQDVRMLARCIALDVDCAAMCRMAAGAMARGSECAAALCAACEQVCDACGRECERHAAMSHCQDCARACFHCVEQCRRMVQTLRSRAGNTERRAA